MKNHIFLATIASDYLNFEEWGRGGEGGALEDEDVKEVLANFNRTAAAFYKLSPARKAEIFPSVYLTTLRFSLTRLQVFLPRRFKNNFTLNQNGRNGIG